MSETKYINIFFKEFQTKTLAVVFMAWSHHWTRRLYLSNTVLQEMLAFINWFNHGKLLKQKQFINIEDFIKMFFTLLGAYFAQVFTRLDQIQLSFQTWLQFLFENQQ